MLKNSLMSPEIENKMHHSEKFLIDLDNVDSEDSDEDDDDSLYTQEKDDEEMID